MEKKSYIWCVKDSLQIDCCLNELGLKHITLEPILSYKNRTWYTTYMTECEYTKMSMSGHYLDPGPI